MLADIGEWYSRIVKETELADYGPNKGDIVIRPYGMQIWNRIITYYTDLIQKYGYQQAYFPLLIPNQFIEKEVNAIEGLAPRLFYVRRREESSVEDSVIRPTSETIINYMLSKWIRTYRDLPLKLFQVSNIVRWEEATHPFIKGREIQWIEGHSVYSTRDDVERDILLVKKSFLDLLCNELAIPTFCGNESSLRKFKGSESTFTFETIAPNAKTLQLGAIYDLGTIFSKMFSVQYQNEKNRREYCYGVNWGIGFRLIGAIALVHGDARGLRIPPRIAPYQVVILPIGKMTNDERTSYINDVKKIVSKSGVRVHVSAIKDLGVKRSISYWEKKGVPLIVLIGENELLENGITVLRRDQEVENNREFIVLDDIVSRLAQILDEVQENLYNQAVKRTTSLKGFPRNRKDLIELIDTKWSEVDWCGDLECERDIIEKNGKILKCVTDEHTSNNSLCIFCGRPARKKVIVAKTY